jgi:DNA-binding GntR family transcriptional regulator
MRNEKMRRSVSAAGTEGESGKSVDEDKLGWASSRSGADNTIADQVYRRLRRAIVNGEIQGRTRLVESNIARKLGASRTPVREAISRLTSDGLVSPHSSGGVEVVDTQFELDDIYRIREALEGCAAALAAVRVTDAELAGLRELVEATRNSDPHDLTSRVRINTEFHQLICAASRSERLIQMVNAYREFFIGEQALGQFTQGASVQALKDHEDILHALRDRDPKRAERLVRRHLEHSRRRIRSGRRPIARDR